MKCRCVLALSFLLTCWAACAQPGPIYFIEHDWTVHVGKAKFGLYQDRWLGDENYGGGRHVTLYLGTASVRLKLRTFRTYSGAFGLAVVTVCMVWFVTHRIRKAEMICLKNNVRRLRP